MLSGRQSVILTRHASPPVLTLYIVCRLVRCMLCILLYHDEDEKVVYQRLWRPNPQGEHFHNRQNLLHLTQFYSITCVCLVMDGNMDCPSSSRDTSGISAIELERLLDQAERRRVSNRHAQRKYRKYAKRPGVNFTGTSEQSYYNHVLRADPIS